MTAWGAYLLGWLWWREGGRDVCRAEPMQESSRFQSHSAEVRVPRGGVELREASVEVMLKRIRILEVDRMGLVRVFCNVGEVEA